MKDFERFFDDNSWSLQVLVDCNEAQFGLEELYQAFKDRMMQELMDEAEVVMVPINVGPTVHSSVNTQKEQQKRNLEKAERAVFRDGNMEDIKEIIERAVGRSEEFQAASKANWDKYMESDKWQP